MSIPDLTDKIIRRDNQCCAVGGFGDVFRCQYASGDDGVQEVAVKAFRFSFSVDGNEREEGKAARMIRRELGIWRRLSHRNIVPFLGITYGFGVQGSMSLVSMWMPHGTLHTFLDVHGGWLAIVHRLQLLLDIANGLNYLHSFPMVHGDLTGNNVLLDRNYNACLTDFGCASLVGELPEGLTYLNMSTVRPGTLRWAAPEHFLLDEEKKHTIKSDIYSFGNMALLVLSGRYPWSEVRADVAVVLRLSQGLKPARPLVPPIDDQHWALIQRCWSSIPERPTTEEVVSSLRELLSTASVPDTNNSATCSITGVLAGATTHTLADGTSSTPVPAQSQASVPDQNISTSFSSVGTGNTHTPSSNLTMSIPETPAFTNINVVTPLERDSVIGTSHPRSKINKRIIICCDGTWQDGVIMRERWKYTNVLKLSRAIKQYDERTEYAIPQVVFYQSGAGDSPNFYSQYIQGKSTCATGTSLVRSVQETYAFISQTFSPGDEIFLFGFSRGAYTARMVAMLIGAIGILDRTDMDHFADIFVAYQKLGKSNDVTEISMLRAKLALWTSPTSRGNLRVFSRDPNFSIKCIGIFDTIGSVGLPEEITRKSPSTKSIFGFPDSELGQHIERAYQALAINETRPDFNCNKFVQTEGGRGKGQVLKQCWFCGEHSDIGGGWQDHDLSDLTLFWMIANIEDMLSMDFEYIRSLPDPVAPWGKQHPHDSRTGIFTLAGENIRRLPIRTDHVTHETIHPSVLEQDWNPPQLRGIIQNDLVLVCSLLPLEIEMKRSWSYVPGKNEPVDSEDSARASGQVRTEAHAASLLTNLKAMLRLS